MKVKSTLIWSVSLLIVISIFFVFKNQKIKLDTNTVKKSVVINYDQKYNLRQTKNDCAPFNAAAVVRIIQNKDVSSEEFAKKIKWRLPNKYTIPIGLEQQLKDNGISIGIPNVSNLSDSEKIGYLTEQLSQGKPIIILGKQGNFQHYITLLGYNSSQDNFYIYDSAFEKGEENLTKDVNGEMPGNRNFTSDEIISFWKGGGMFGFYKWYLIVADHSK